MSAIIPDLFLHRDTTPGAAALEGPPVPVPRTVDDLASGHARMIDTYVYDYPTLMQNAAPFAQVTSATVPHVAVIGSGFAGVTASYELRRAGARVTVFEGARRGGRAHTVTPPGTTGQHYEMGPMRVPENSKLFWRYLARLGLGKEQARPFGNPGTVATQLLYQDEQSVEWMRWAADEGGRRPGGEWAAIIQAIGGFLLGQKADVPGGEPVTAEEVIGLLRREDLNKPEGAEARRRVQIFWAKMLSDHEGVTFAEAVARHFREQGKPWDEAKFARFATIGLGTGGFGPLFPISFAEIMRLVAWDYAVEYAPPITMAQYVDRLAKAVPLNPATTVDKAVRYVGRALEGDAHDPEAGPDADAAVLVWLDGEVEPRRFDYAIVAAPLRSMQLTMNLDAPRAPAEFISVARAAFAGSERQMLRDAIRVPHAISSSKLFGYLPVKPWVGNATWPRVKGVDGTMQPVKCVLTDTLARQTYFVDAHPDDDEAGVVVLLSYNWGDDAVRHQALGQGDPSKRAATLRDAYLRALATASCCDQATVRALSSVRLLSAIDWQLEPMIFGGFKLTTPGQYPAMSRLVYHYQSKGERVFLANNNCSFQGGWIEGAMQAAINAASAVLRDLQGRGLAKEFRMGDLFAPDPFQPSFEALCERGEPAR